MDYKNLRNKFVQIEEKFAILFSYFNNEDKKEIILLFSSFFLMLLTTSVN